MANPKVVRTCRQCGVTREHYTRRNGRTISPCCECQIAKSKRRQDAIRDDPDALEEQREKWKRIKNRQRMIARGEIGTATGEPDFVPQATMRERRARRRRRKRPPSPPESPVPRRRRARSATATTPTSSMEAGLN